MIIRAYLVSLSIFLVVDGAWLSFMVPNFYQPEMAGLMRDTVIWPAALLFYLLYPAALAALAVVPGCQTGRMLASTWRGALLGAAAYGTYNLTNYSTLQDWPLSVTVVDQIWGTSLGAIVASLAWLGMGRHRQPAQS